MQLREEKKKKEKQAFSTVVVKIAPLNMNGVQMTAD